MRKLTVNGSWTQFLCAMRDKESFRTHGALKGDYYPNGSHTIPTGRLEGESLTRFRQDSIVGIEYVVLSYGTPIAWRTIRQGEVWQENDDRYSVTTSKHQGRIFPGTTILINDVMNRTNVAHAY